MMNQEELKNAINQLWLKDIIDVRTCTKIWIAIDVYFLNSSLQEKTPKVGNDEYTKEYCPKKNGYCRKHSDKSCDICDFNM